jgi:hypothetical protein
MKQLQSFKLQWLMVLLFVAAAQAGHAQNKSFTTKELYYAACPSPAEEFRFTWNAKTGVVSDFYWNHGGVKWFLYTATAIVSKVVRDEKTLYDYDVYLNVTTKGYETTAYQIRAKMTLTAMRPNGASFGGIYEGTGTTWIAANGTYSEK